MFYFAKVISDLSSFGEEENHQDNIIVNAESLSAATQIIMDEFDGENDPVVNISISPLYGNEKVLFVNELENHPNILKKFLEENNR